MLETNFSNLAKGVQVHRVDDDLTVIRNKLLINRMMEGPGLQRQEEKNKEQKNVISATSISYYDTFKSLIYGRYLSITYIRNSHHLLSNNVVENE